VCHFVGSEAMNQEIPPVMLPAYVVSKTQWAVWCFHCGCLHFHGSLPGGRIAHCIIEGSPYKSDYPEYYMVPTGKPLPEGAMKLHNKGRAKVRRHIYSRHPKPYVPLPVPEWGQPLYLRTYCEALSVTWETEQGQTPEEVEHSRQHFQKTWDQYAVLWEAAKAGKRKDKLFQALRAAA